MWFAIFDTGKEQIFNRTQRRQLMKSTPCWLGLVMVTLFVFNGTGAALASPVTTTVDVEPAAGQSLVYLPMIGQGYLLFNDAISAFEPAATAGVFEHAFDATPDPDGNLIYFTATSAQGPGVFRVPATGGEVVPISVGIPLTMPAGLAISTGGETLFVADSQVDVAHDGAAIKSPAVPLSSHREGAIFRLSAGGVATSGDVATPVAGTEHTTPRGLEVVEENGAEMIYFTGFTGSGPNDDQPAVMKVPAEGGPLTVIAKGAPLVEPVGVTVDANGVVYVTDQAAGGNGLGSVFRITGGNVETLASPVRTGDPAGIALTLDESLLLVSALETNRDSSMVLVIDLVGGRQGVVNAVIGANIGSGGLHRAHNRNLLAWCGVTTGGGGIVYRVELR
jgi:sugar lactone lactonase YvrE